MPQQLTLLLEAALATVLAGGQIVGWVGLGLPIARRLEDEEIAVPVAFFIGSATTALAYALLSWAGHVTSAILMGVALSLLGCALGGRDAAAALTRLGRTIPAALARSSIAFVGIGVLGVCLWFLAAAPPRDADVLRYHLAHIAQIVQDGRWTALPDFTYALPFGWSINFLPFVRIGLPVAANFLSLFVTLLTICLVVRMLRRIASPPLLAAIVVVLLVLQPWMLKLDTTAHADAYVILAAATLTRLLLEPVRTSSGAFAVGFVAIVALQSRYQAAALAGAAAIILAADLARRRTPLRACGSALGGAACAAVLAAPFYVRNALAFGDPFWPLQPPGFRGSTYADQVMSSFARGLNGTLSVDTVRHSVPALLRDPSVFPVPLAGVLSLAVVFGIPALRRRGARVASFVCAFFAIWLVAQPALFSRFLLLAVAPIALLTAIVIDPLVRRAGTRLATAAAVLAITPFAAYGAYYSLDTARLFLTGDVAAYQAYTWYWSVYRWLDQHTPPQRALLIVQAGQTFYFDRPYRRADPQLSGIIDWEVVSTGRHLARVLRAGGYGLVVYDTTPLWRGDLGGAKMMRAISEARREGSLRLIRTFHVELASNRVRRIFEPATVEALAVVPPPGVTKK